MKLKSSLERKQLFNSLRLTILVGGFAAGKYAFNHSQKPV
jgi:hypothetical protein